MVILVLDFIPNSLFFEAQIEGYYYAPETSVLNSNRFRTPKSL
ncbi:protein of unknown function [Candidatus Nitrosocaldus cavascurensis]|jgi:hypothetical protein|uniref:Uncharacterized protein n=1 Tax=Candidatus Nitrosocaldus cavascurensis TaxID=2058097 RepID=A0A2K5ASM8_9ARCH|nr:protein of unknown function [Candidatus Nitrosocaldus cavascurensis]